jgi:serine protease
MTTPRPASVLRAARLVCELLEDRLALDGSLLKSLSVSDYRPDQILVQFKPDASPSALAGTTLASSLSLVPGLYEVDVPTGLDLAAVLDAYAADPRVHSAQPDYVVQTEALPNDPLINNQWAIRSTNPQYTINAAAAWDKTTGSGRTIVAVMDTGVDYNHPDLAPNMWRNAGEVAGNGFDDDGNGFIDDVFGYNFVNNNGNPMDLNGHGTHVAGIIGAQGNNGIGVTGVNWDVQIMALRFLDTAGRGSTSDALRALNYAVQMGATISNNSWTSPAYDSFLEAGIRNAGQAGHIYVAAAGNSGQNLNTSKVYPAAFTADNLITVGGLDSYNRLAGWSNRGSLVEIAAPGTSIYSTLPNGKYGYMSGTSMATPFVTGAVALVRDQNPAWSAQQVIQRVLSTADSLTSLNGLIAGGRLNVGAAVTNASTPIIPPVTDTTGARVTALASIISNNRIVGLRVTFSEAIQASSFTTSDVLSVTGPGGSLAVTSILPVAGTTTQFDVRFAEQSQTGTYAITLETGILDNANNALNQNGNVTSGENPGDRYTGSINYSATNSYQAQNMPASVLDYATTPYTLNITDSMAIQNVRVEVNISHGWMSDLVLKLRAPNGAEVLLANRRGGGGKGYQGTTFSDSASQSILSGYGTFTGTYRPEMALSKFRGQSTAGTWSLIVEDKARGDGGNISSWSLSLDAQAGSSSVTSPTKRTTLRPEVLQQLVSKATTTVQQINPTTHRLTTQDILPLKINPPRMESPITILPIKREQQKAQLLSSWKQILQLSTHLK